MPEYNGAIFREPASGEFFARGVAREPLSVGDVVTFDEDDLGVVRLPLPAWMARAARSGAEGFRMVRLLIEGPIGVVREPIPTGGHAYFRTATGDVWGDITADALA